MAFCYVGDTDEEAHAHRPEDPLVPDRQHEEQCRRCRSSSPARFAPEMAPAAWRGGASKRPTDLTVEALIAQGQMFAGNPDTVVQQIKEFRHRVGGVGRIIMMTRQGLVTHAEAMKSFTLAASEVLPQLQDLEPLDT